MQQIEALIDQATTGHDRKLRRQAFIELISGEQWKRALDPQVIAQQGYTLREGFFPDLASFAEAAPIIAVSEEKIQHMLEILGSRFSEELLFALAKFMGRDLVEHVLAHLRTAQGERAVWLQQILFKSDPHWVEESLARRIIRQQLRTPSRNRYLLLRLLADIGNLSDFVEEIIERPPIFAEEWHALGKANVSQEEFINRALADLGTGPEPLAYLLQLDPIPESVILRMMAAARPDWLIHSFEVAVSLDLQLRPLILMAELGIRLGGRPMSMAISWLHATKLGAEVLSALSGMIFREGKHTRINDLLWVQRHTSSASLALEVGRKGGVPDPMDAAALIRQLRGDRIIELVREILNEPYPAMMEAVLHPLCGVSIEAANQVVLLCKSRQPEIAQRAQQARLWPDVVWPEEAAATDEDDD